MNCKETQDFSGDALDRNLAEDKKADFFAHLKECPPCRTEFEIEVLAKGVVRSTLKHVATPSSVAQAVLELVRRQSAEAVGGRSWYGPLLSWRFLAPTLAAGLTVLALTFLLILPIASPDSKFDHTTSNDIINQSLRNFSLVQSGELKPSMVACFPEVVVGYFQKQDYDFSISIPSDDSCDWYGAMASVYDGVKLAHVMYKRGEDLVYVYEIRRADALEGSALSLPAAAKESLAQTGWYNDPQHDDCSVFVWTVNETLCAAVSTMKKDRLMAFLTPR